MALWRTTMATTMHTEASLSSSAAQLMHRLNALMRAGLVDPSFGTANTVNSRLLKKRRDRAACASVVSRWVRKSLTLILAAASNQLMWAL